MNAKKLIEVALPLEKINAASAREKSIRHGHPSTLHLWWARRPLAAARAVIWSSLVDDPSSHPELFPTEETQSIERQRLFKILEDLVIWENSNNQDVLDAAKAEIAKSTNGNPPALLDPFAGGGAIPLEAKRLGIRAYAHDLNPVPVLINKSMLELPSRFAEMHPVNPSSDKLSLTGMWKGMEGVAEDIKYYGALIKEKMQYKLKSLYPEADIPAQKGGGSAPVIAWLWSRTVKCPNPACRCQMPLYKSSVLAKNIAYFTVEKNKNGDPVFTVKDGKPDDDKGTVNRRGARCVFCGTPVSFQYIREEGKNKRIGSSLMAIVAKGAKGRIYITPTETHKLAAIEGNDPEVELGKIANYPGYLNPPAYGLDEFQDLFTKRQLIFLSTLVETIKEVGSIVELHAIDSGLKDDHIPLSEGGLGARAYSEMLKVYFAFLLDKIADYNSNVCSWNSVGQKMRNTFGLTGMSMAWDYAEANPFSGASGSFDNMLNWVVKSVTSLPTTGEGYAEQHDAQTDSNLDRIMISTDPPYYSNVPYADFADFFYVWLRLNLGNVYPDLFSTLLTPKTEELVADPYRWGGKEKAAQIFESGMLSACKQMYKNAVDEVPVTIYYAFKEQDITQESNKSKTSTGWETMLTAIIEAGFSITGTWPMRTEMSSRTRGMNANALASSIVLVCRKRSDDAPQITRRGMVNTLRKELRPALKKLQDSNIAPVDLAQSAIGPGMAVFSRYRRVLEADGTAMTVRSALRLINDEVDIYFNEQIGEMDAMSRFCIDLYTQNAFNDIKFGDADILARAKGTSVAAIANHDVIYAKGGNVHLIDRTELSESIDKDESCIWLLTQQLTQAMATGGIEACAKAVYTLFGSNAERAKDLAYRLYTIAEQKKWASEAYAYNALVVAWPDIQTRAAMLERETPEQIDLFEAGLLE